MKQYIIPVFAVWLFVSAVGVILTVHDKRAAKRGSRRVPEATLMLWGLLGGAAAMFVTMRIIRHKTRHPKFMFGLPAEILLHLLLLFLLIRHYS